MCGRAELGPCSIGSGTASESLWTSTIGAARRCSLTVTSLRRCYVGSRGFAISAEIHCLRLRLCIAREVSNRVASVDDPSVIASLLPPSVLFNVQNLGWTLCATDRRFTNPVTSAIFHPVKVLPVSHGEGIYQKDMDMALSKLNCGGWVRIFPEGSHLRDGGRTVGSAKRRVGRLVPDADATPIIVPFVHTRMQDIMPIGANVPRIGRTGRVITNHTQMRSLTSLLKCLRVVPSTSPTITNTLPACTRRMHDGADKASIGQEELQLQGDITSIFESSGKSKPNFEATQFIRQLKNCGDRAGDSSLIIFNYAARLSSVVEDVIKIYRSLHEKSHVKYSSQSVEKLIQYCCTSHQLDAALDVVEQMCDRSNLSTRAVHSIMQGIDKSFELQLVYRIYPILCRYEVALDKETFYYMLRIVVRTKNGKVAGDMLHNLSKFSLTPTIAFYNCVIRGCLQRKEYHAALKMWERVKGDQSVKPNANTFDHLMLNSKTKEEIDKFYREAENAGIRVGVTDMLYVARLVAYGSIGLFFEVEQIMQENEMGTENSNMVKRTLISYLARRGQEDKAVTLYEEMKGECEIKPEVILRLMGYIKSDGKLNILLKLQGDLTQPDHICQGHYIIAKYCVINKHLSTAVDSLKAIKDFFLTRDDEVVLEVIFDEVFSRVALQDGICLQVCLDLLFAIKNELDLSPSRQVLDFFLDACITAKDRDMFFLIWKEYEAIGLSYNIQTFMRLYEGCLAFGDREFAITVLGQIDIKNDDRGDIRFLVEGYQKSYNV